MVKKNLTIGIVVLPAVCVMEVVTLMKYVQYLLSCLFGLYFNNGCYSAVDCVKL